MPFLEIDVFFHGHPCLLRAAVVNGRSDESNKINASGVESYLDFGPG